MMKKIIQIDLYILLMLSVFNLITTNIANYRMITSFATLSTKRSPDIRKHGNFLFLNAFYTNRKIYIPKSLVFA